MTYQIPPGRTWQSTPVLLPGKFHGWRSLVGYSPWGHKELDMTEWLHFLSFYSSFWRKIWQPTPVFLPGESHGWRGLLGCSLWGCKESDTTKQLTHTHTSDTSNPSVSSLKSFPNPRDQGLGISDLDTKTTFTSAICSLLFILYKYWCLSMS